MPIAAYLCTQGEQSDCDMENRTAAIPEAIKTVFDLDVDITFGMGDEGAEGGDVAEDGEAAGTRRCGRCRRDSR